jgi:hypothetical protein
MAAIAVSALTLLGAIMTLYVVVIVSTILLDRVVQLVTKIFWS